MKNLNDIWNNSSSNDKLDYTVSLIVVALAVVFILYYVFGSQPRDLDMVTTDQSEIFIPIPSDENLKSIKNIIVSTRSYKSTHDISVESDSQLSYLNSEYKTDVLLDTTVYSADDTVVIDSLIVDTLSSVVQPAVDSTGVEHYQDQYSEINETSMNSSTLKDTIEKEDLEYDEQTKVDSEQNETSNVDNNIIAKECIILVGSYAKLKNANRMFRKLESAGFHAFKSQNNRFTRVGIYSSCDSNILESNLGQMRNRFASDAIHLVED